VGPEGDVGRDDDDDAAVGEGQGEVEGDGEDAEEEVALDEWKWEEEEAGAADQEDTIALEGAWDADAEDNDAEGATDDVIGGRDTEEDSEDIPLSLLRLRRRA
jgi:hypothetical protein